jgi:hypothetical protein
MILQFGNSEIPVLNLKVQLKKSKYSLLSLNQSSFDPLSGSADLQKEFPF